MFSQHKLKPKARWGGLLLAFFVFMGVWSGVAEGARYTVCSSGCTHVELQGAIYSALGDNNISTIMLDEAGIYNGPFVVPYPDDDIYSWINPNERGYELSIIGTSGHTREAIILDNHGINVITSSIGPLRYYSRAFRSPTIAWINPGSQTDSLARDVQSWC